ncbi:MAG TPA: hypothetical protein VF656_20090 [Pyrinomonadaceae bacterium]|jgi:hypothetical protein
MKSKLARLVFALALTLVPAARSWGQDATLTDEAKIKQYQSTIQLMINNAPPAGSAAEPTYRSGLLSLRRKLRDLLLEKRGAYKQSIRNLQPQTNVPEVQALLRQFQSELQSVETELKKLDGDPAADATVAAAEPTGAPPGLTDTNPTPSAAGNGSDTIGTGSTGSNTAMPNLTSGTNVTTPAQPAASPTPTLQQQSFEARVNNLSATDLRDAAAPSEVMESALPEPGCNSAGRPNSTRFSRLDEFVCRLASDVSKRRTKRILLSQDQAPLFAIMIAKLLKTTGTESYAAFVADAQDVRTDQQLGAGPNSTGTTSLVSRGGIPYAFGFAVENGAAVQTRSDTSITFRVNPVGAVKALSNKGFITGFRESERDPVLNFFRKTSFGFTFDTDRGSDPGVFTGDKQQLSAFSFRYEFMNERDPRHKVYEAEWERFVANEGVQLASQIWATTLALNDFGTRTSNISFKDPALQAWLEQTNTLIAATSGTDLDELERIIRSQANLLPVELVTDETVDAVTGFARQFQAYTTAKNRLLDRIAKGRILTFEYTNNREVSAPDTSNFTFIASTGTERRISLTANGTLTMFNKRPQPAAPADPRPGRIRDFQFAGQADIPFNLGEAGQFVFWFSGRYERLVENASALGGALVPNTKGDIAVGQFGLRIPIRSLGIHFPISFTFANRTEFVKEKEVRGNFGFTFNLDSILAKFKPF